MTTLGIPTERRDYMRAQAQDGDTDTEPLLGAPGDATQRPYDGFMWNVLTGTAAITQGGIWVLTAIIWAAIFESKLMFFSVHPLVNSAGLLLMIQAILVLQPTHTQKQKIRGAYVHSFFNLLALACFITGHVVIEINKAPHPDQRYQSIHSKLGVVTYVLIYIQFVVGVAQFYFQRLIGVDRAKSIYKYHRMSGYVILTLGLVTVCFAALTTLNKNMLHMRLWTLITTSVLVMTGIIPRIKKSKFGL